MSCVYLAHDPRLGRSVALKVLLGSLARNPVNVRLFHREAQAAAPLRHANIVRIYSAGVESGTPYIAMEYVAGESLERFLRRKGRQKWQTALYIGEQVAAALQCAHDNGVTHHDIKPANILLDQRGRVRLTDFGIARVTQSADQDPVTGVFGTPHYMAPELCEGGNATPQTDLYALGVTLYELMVGEVPFQSDSPVVLVKRIATEVAPRLNRLRDDVPDDVARLVAHLLAKNPNERPTDAGEVRTHIERLMTEGGGRSAIPDALAAFVKEQAREAHLRVLTPPPKTQHRKDKRPARSLSALMHWARGRTQWLAAAASIAAIALFAGMWAGTGSQVEASRQPAPTLSTVRFDTPFPGTIFVRLPIEAFQFSDARWVGDQPAILIRANGAPGTFYQGQAGVLSIDPGAQTCSSVIAPGVAPSFGAAAAVARVNPMPKLPPDSLLENAFIIHDINHSGRNTTQTMYAKAHRFDEAHPNREPLFQLPMGEEKSRVSVYTIPHPNGDRVCVAMHDPLHQGYFLVEFPVPFTGTPDEGTRLTTTDTRLVPETIAYAHNGAQVGYLLSDTKGRYELWVVGTDGAVINGAPIANGLTDTAFAFDANGARALLSRAERADALSTIQIVAVADGSVLNDLGPGRVGDESWHPSGQFIVAIAPDSEGREQLWAVETSQPHRRKQLTILREGIRGKPSVSRDGKWAAAFGNTPSASMVFVDVSALEFGPANGTTANHTPSPQVALHRNAEDRRG